jgi:hypothetical protein
MEAFDIAPELTDRLGRIVIRWASVEGWIAAMLPAVANADPGAMQAITVTTGVKAQIDWIRNILSVHIDKNPELQEAIDLLERAEELRIDRNALVHGVWDGTGCIAGTAIINTVRLERSEIIKGTLVTCSDLDQFLIEIDNWLADYAEIGRRLGFPRLADSDKSIFA